MSELLLGNSMELGKTSLQCCVWEFGTFKLIFFLSAKIQFCSDLQCRHTPCLGLLATGRIAADCGRDGMDQLLAVGFKGSFIIKWKIMTASTGLPGICYVLREMALITFLYKAKLFLVFKYSLLYLCWVILTLSNSFSSGCDRLTFMPSPVTLHHATYLSELSPSTCM